MKRETQYVAVEKDSQDPYRSISTPIYQTATFEQENPDLSGSYDYSRSGNPTRAVLEQKIAAIEGGQRSFAYASGMAAIGSVLSLLQPGDEIIAHSELYGGTCRLIDYLAKGGSFRVHYVDASKAENVACRLNAKTRLVWIETPSNPSQTVIDIRKIVNLLKPTSSLLAVDNTMLSPHWQNPLSLGADIVVHSATKHLSGHSDLTAGCVVANDPEILDKLSFHQNAAGQALGPFESWLLLRGMKTLGVRLDRGQANALILAQRLENHSLIRQVLYLGLDSHPGRDVHDGQARGAGVVIGALVDTDELAFEWAQNTRLFPITVSFGGVHSSLSIPSKMSHASLPLALKKLSPPNNLVRISCGLEDPEDLWNDLERSLELARKRSMLSIQSV